MAETTAVAVDLAKIVFELAASTRPPVVRVIDDDDSVETDAGPSR